MDHPASPADAAALVVRFARHDDKRQIERLAALDSGPVPTGPALVAEVDGRIVAVLPLGGGTPLADPFTPTTEVVRLLRLRESQLRGLRRARRRARGAAGRVQPIVQAGIRPSQRR
jgi:hypothetical protein